MTELSEGEAAGRAIKAVRALRSLSQKELAQRARIAPVTRLGQIERGLVAPSPAELRRI
jgi:transcriptional regulator with XRE-family HTH domain